MDRPHPFPHPASLRHRAELERALAACHGATLRLEQTHEALHEEVCRLAEELENKNRELARKSRLADLGRMVEHVTQETHGHVVPLSLYLGLLRRRLTSDAPAQDLLNKIEANLASLDEHLNELLFLSSDHTPDVQAFQLRPLIDEVFREFTAELAAQGIETIFDVPRSLNVTADRKMLRCAIRNLTRNAIDAMPRGGRLVFTSYRGTGGVELEVADSGIGLDDEARRRAFEPFFSTKPDGPGLGLAIVGRIAEAHGGDVVAMNCPEGGAAFTLRFPDRALWAAG